MNVWGKWEFSSLVLLAFFLSWQSVSADIGCYYCTSVNNSDRHCEDPVNPGNVDYKSQCKQGQRGHNGLFIANYCTKIKAIRVSDNLPITVRRCSLDKLTETEDHCGQFRLDNDLYLGCIATCDRDGCNHSNEMTYNKALLILISTLSIFMSSLVYK